MEPFPEAQVSEWQAGSAADVTLTDKNSQRVVVIVNHLHVKEEKAPQPPRDEQAKRDRLVKI